MTLQEYLKLYQRIKSRKITISPQQGKAGIPTGVVLVYGHIMLPPFVIIGREGKILINGVQVIPSLIRERANEEWLKSIVHNPERTANRRRIGRLYVPAREINFTNIDKLSQRIRHDKVIALFDDAKDIVQNLHWQGEELCFVERKTQLATCWNLGNSVLPQYSVEDAKKFNNAVLARQAEEIETALRHGEFVTFHPNGQFGSRPDCRNQVTEIMEQPDLNREQRIEELKDKVFDGSYDVPLEIIDNYDANQWRVDR